LDGINYPPFSKQQLRVQSYYKIVFNKEGFPIKDGTQKSDINPIYGIYVIKDWIKEYKRTNDTVYIDAAVKVADIAIRMMEKVNDCYFFEYKKGEYISRGYKDHISALTQSYYAIELMNLYKIVKEERFQEAANNCFKSLLIPVKQNGVLYEWGDKKVSIEEFPNEPNDFILNGWQTSLLNVLKYYKLSKNPKAKELFDRSASSLSEVLHLFDCEEYKNSRYALTGFTYVKLMFSNKKKNAIEVSKVEMLYPGHETVEVDLNVDKKERNRYKNYAFDNDMNTLDTKTFIKKNQLRLNVLTSRITYPQTNSLSFSCKCDTDCTMKLYVYKGVYNPLSSSQVNCNWEEVNEFKLLSGENHVEASLDFKGIGLTAYPTNFLKLIRGNNYNVYHYIHILNLEQLYDETGYEVFRDYAVKWKQYTEDWPKMDLYKGLKHLRHTEDKEGV